MATGLRLVCRGDPEPFVVTVLRLHAGRALNHGPWSLVVVTLGALGVNPSGLVFMLVASGVNSSLLEFMLVALRMNPSGLEFMPGHELELARGHACCPLRESERACVHV